MNMRVVRNVTSISTQPRKRVTGARAAINGIIKIGMKKGAMNDTKHIRHRI